MQKQENMEVKVASERWFHLTSQEVLMRLTSSLSGLHAKDVIARQARFGRNEFDHKKKRSSIKLFLSQFQESLAIILLVAAGFAFVFGEFRDATIIFVIVFANAVISFIQEFKAEKILDHMERLVTAHALVIRDGEKKEIDATELVPGDIIAMNAGARVPADAYILESYSCKVDGFIFSGESRPEKREAKVMKDEVTPMSDIENMLFMGESVVAGEAVAVVVATGAKTELGRLADMASDATADVTPLQKKMKALGRNVTILAVVIGVGTVLLGRYFGLSWYENFLLALALAVSVVPEGLPAAISVALALGMKRLLKYNVLAKRLSAVETLGSVTVICTDKTGTITRNELMVTRIVTGKTVYEVTGDGYIPTGNFFANGEVVNARTIPNAEMLFRIGTLCNDASLVHDDKTAKYSIAGDPTEGAMLVAARKFNADPNFFAIGEHKIMELPFASERMCMSVAYKNAHVQSLVKGSPDVLLELATHRLDESGQVILFSEAEKQETRKLYDGFSREALRVLAFAYRDLKDVPEARYGNEMERDLVWVGMMAMIDPPRADVAQAIEECHALGLRVMMITGDYAITAEAIARQSHLIDNTRPYVIVSGRELLEMSDDAVYALFQEKEIVFARIAPEQKLRLATILQEHGEVVAMTGDGVNDAPALKRADIGVAMGIMGTDVSKEAADMILLDDNFASIVYGVKEGRTVYSNLRNFTHYVFTSNVSELFTVLFGLLLHIPAPLIAVQILAIDLGTDVLPSFALGLEPAEKESMQQRQVQQSNQIITRQGVKRLLVLGLIMAVGGISTFLYSLMRHGWHFGESIASDNPAYLQAATATYIVLAVTQMANLLQSRSERLSFFKVGIFRNLYVWGAMAFSFGIIWLFLNVPFFETYLHMTKIDSIDWIMVALFTSIVFLYEEWRKYRLSRINSHV